MGIFNRKKEIKNEVSLQELMANYVDYNGELITVSTATRIAVVYSCVNVIAETLGTLPIKIYKTNKNGSRESVTNVPFYRTLQEPNKMQSQFDFKEIMAWNLLLRGKFFAFKILNMAGEVTELLPINPDSVSVVKENYQYKFIVDGVTYDAKRIFYILTKEGKSVLETQSQTFNLALTKNNFSSSVYKNQGTPNLVIKTAKEFVNDEAFQTFKKRWQDTYGGAGNARKMAILSPGMDIAPLNVSASDVELLESMKYSDTQICGLFRVPPHLVGILDHATYSNIEEQSIEFARYTILPWVSRIEQAFNNQCIKDKDLKCEFLMDGLERGNTTQRYEAYNKAINATWMTPDEVRAKENMNPLPDGMGEKPLRPKNMYQEGELENGQEE